MENIYGFDINVKLNEINLKDGITGFVEDKEKIYYQDVEFAPKVTSMYAKGSKYILGVSYQINEIGDNAERNVFSFKIALGLIGGLINILRVGLQTIM